MPSGYNRFPGIPGSSFHNAGIPLACSQGKGWKYVCDPLIMRGKFDASFDDQVAEIAMTIAAGLDAGIY